MVMIDQLLYCEGATAGGTLEIRDDNVFLSNGVMTESGMIEALAQTAAARTGWMMRVGEQEKRRRGEREGMDIPVGVIGSIKDFRLFFYPRKGDLVSMEIEVKHEFMNASVIQGRVKVREEVACDLEMKIFLTDANAD